MNIINDPIAHVDISAVNYVGSLDSTGCWDNITMDVGQEFENMRTFRDDLCKYAFARGFRYRFINNEHTRVTAKCKRELFLEDTCISIMSYADICDEENE